MSFKKAILLSIGILGMMQVSLSHAAYHLCKEGVVTSLSAGEIDQSNMIKACIGGSCYTVHPDSALNHSSGNALLTLLLYAKSTGSVVALYTHSTENNKDCKKKQFDEVYIN